MSFSPFSSSNPLPNTDPELFVFNSLGATRGMNVVLFTSPGRDLSDAVFLPLVHTIPLPSCLSPAETADEKYGRFWFPSHYRRLVTLPPCWFPGRSGKSLNSSPRSPSVPDEQRHSAENTPEHPFIPPTNMDFMFFPLRFLPPPIRPSNPSSRAP